MDPMTRRMFLHLLGASACSRLFAGSCGPPPPAHEQTWKAAESFPPLPLPATPLRRSEKKRPPSPPTLVGKLQYGKVVEATGPDGKRASYRDWTTDPGDLESLMNRANLDLGLRYKGQEIELGKFSFQPQEIPVLYLTGHEGFAFSPEERTTIHRYLHDGGALFGDACCGSEDYRRAFLAEIRGIFPDRKMKILPPDHPVYTAFHALGQVGYVDEKKGAFEGPPLLEGVSIGCREAVCLSQFDLSCGWDGHAHDKGRRVWPAEGALRLGVNLLAYQLATYRLGLYLAATAVAEDRNADTAGTLAIGQIVHGGDWDPNPSALVTLVKHARRRSTLAASFRRENVELAAGRPAQPVLYLTGHDDFVLSPPETESLRAHLAGGGFLLADACCGRKSFDAAFRRELAKVLPDRPLAPLAPDHALLRMAADTTAAEGTPYLNAKRKAAGLAPLVRPELEAVETAGGIQVLYSPLGIGCGWEDEACPCCLGYAPATARDLGLNALAYAMTH